jgi:hypothetical protein
MLKAFVGNQFLLQFLLPVFALIYILLNGYFDYFHSSTIIDLGIWGEIKNINPVLVSFIGVFIAVLNSILLNRIFNKNGFYEKNTYVVSLIYIVLISFYQSFYTVNGILIAHLFIILGVVQLFKLENNVDGRRYSFNAGFIFGIAATFHPSLFIFLPFLWVLITRIRPFVLRESLLSSIGFAIPIIYGLMWIFQKEHQIKFDFIDVSRNSTKNDLVFWLTGGLLFVIATFSLIGVLVKNNKSSIRFKRLSSILLLLLLFGIILGVLENVFFNQKEGFSVSLLSISLFFPFSIFYKSTQLLATIFFYLLFGFSLVKFFL